MFSHTLGVGIFIIHEGQIILGRRKKVSRGSGMIALPGGHVESGEAAVAAVQREADEETGMDVMVSDLADPPFSIPGLVAVTDHADPKQQANLDFIPHITLWIATYWTQEKPPVNREPDKNEKWEWMNPFDPKITVSNPYHPQYYWTPTPLWRARLPTFLRWTFDRKSSQLVPWLPEQSHQTPISASTV